MSSDQSAWLAHLPVFDIGPLHKEVLNLLTSYRNHLARLWPRHIVDPGGGRTALRGIVAVTENTYKTVVFVCADAEDNPARKVEFSLSVPSLARSVLDAVYTVVYLFNNFSENVPHYYRSGWREAREALERYRSVYGNDPAWTEHIRSREEHLEAFRKELGITLVEAAAWEDLPLWPIPSRVLKNRNLSSERRVFLQYLYDWFYRELSQDDHLSWPGLTRRSAPLLDDERSADTKALLAKRRSDLVGTMIALTLSVLAEIESELHYGEAQRLVYAWTLLGSYHGDAKEIYDRRYRALLAPQ